MYIIDELDSVTELSDMPAPERIASPIVFAEGGSVVLSYWMLDEPPFEPTTAPLAILRFDEVYLQCSGPPLHYSGPAEHEALVGHPLLGRGRFARGVFRVNQSSLVRHFERMNSVHPYHDQPKLDAVTHYIFTFDDSTFECIAGSVYAAVENCGMDEEYGRMLDHLHRY